jgi:hypothetical protein
MHLNPSIIKQINDLKAQATSRNLIHKCEAIAQRLGKSVPKKHGDTIIYDLPDLNLAITYDTYVLNMRVVFNKTDVFKVHSGEIVTYRPDINSWENYIDTLYIELISPIEAKEILTQQKSLELSIKEHWGISTPA